MTRLVFLISAALAMIVIVAFAGRAVAKVRFGPIVDSRVTANCARICGIDKLVLIESARSAAA